MSLTRRGFLFLVRASAIALGARVVGAPLAEANISPTKPTKRQIEAFELFPKALETRLAHKCVDIEQLTGLPAEDALTCAFDETRLGIHTKGRGIVEIIDQTFLDMAANYGSDYKEQIAFHEEIDEILKAERRRQQEARHKPKNELRPSRKNSRKQTKTLTKIHDDRPSHVLDLYAKVMDPTNKPEPKTIREKCRDLAGCDLMTLRQKVLKTRDNHYVSLVFTARRLMDDRQALEVELRKKGLSHVFYTYKDYLCRILHIWPGYAKEILTSPPGVPILKITKTPSVLETHNCPMDISVGAFLKRHNAIYAGVRRVFSYCLAMAEVTHDLRSDLPEKSEHKMPHNYKPQAFTIH